MDNIGTPININQRIFLIVILFLYITTMYTLEGIFISGQDELKSAYNESEIVLDETGIVNPENYSYSDVEVKTNPIDVVFGFFGFLAFAPLGLPAFAQTIITITIVICAIVISLLIYVFIRDWIPLV